MEHQPHHHWCSFILHPFHYHYLRLRHFNLLPTAYLHRKRAPLLSGGMWPWFPVPSTSKAAWNLAVPAPPLSIGMWAVLSCSMKDWGWGNTRGDPESGRPMQCITKTGHDICCGPFSSIHLSSSLTNDVQTPHSTRTCMVTPPKNWPYCDEHSKVHHDHRHVQNDTGWR